MPPRLIIISGGQSGVDRAALDAAIARGIPYGGWCPKGGWAEDLPKPPGVLTRYPLLQETPSAAPEERTEWNVRDSDASLILVEASGVSVSGGTALAARFSGQYAKPLLVVDVGAPDAVERATAWLAALLAAHRSDAPFRLAIGGPRESEAPGIYTKAKGTLGEVVEKPVGWVGRAAP
jgi:Circularly permutated YpsA SLOG family